MNRIDRIRNTLHHEEHEGNEDEIFYPWEHRLVRLWRVA